MKSKLSIILVAVCLSAGCTGSISERHHEEPPVLLYSLDNKDRLIQMAEKRFGKLTEADEILFAAVADGNWADYWEGGGKDKIEDANSWGERRIIKADRIEWLCYDKNAKELVTNKGILVNGAKIDGGVDLGFAEISFPFSFLGCVFNERIDIKNSRMKMIALSGSHTGSILADWVKVEGGVFLRDGFKANGEVRFLGAAIGGDFDCNNGKFINEGGAAIIADRIEVKGTVFLTNGFKANGEVRFPAAAIGGDFVCENGEFINKDGRAISADGIGIKGTVFLKNGFKANGEVRFPEAAIGVNFDCNNGEFINEDGKAIFADGIGIKSNVSLRNGFKAEGEVSFLGATVDGDFDCTSGEFINKDGDAICADGINVKGCVFLNNGFKAEGEVRFLGAVIGTQFVCMNSEFINKGGDALSAEGMDVKGSVFLRDGFKAEGVVDFIGAIVGGYFMWTDVNLTEKTILDLRNAEAGVLWDDEKSWPKKGNLFLDGFVYKTINDDAPKDAKSRIEWLNRQGEERFRPGPYEQLANVLNKMGHSEDAKKILIEKESKLTRLGGFGRWRRFLRGVLGVTIEYGYRPWRALWFIGFFILLGFMIFRSGYKTGVIVPVEKEAYVSGQGGQLRAGYPKFSFLASLVYSIDMFVPVVDLRMAKYWRPDANKLWGNVICWYMWVHICAGWVLTTLWVVGLTGLVKR